MKDLFEFPYLSISVGNSISSAPIPEKFKVLLYMKRSPKIATTSGSLIDEFTGKAIPGGNCYYSDGEYFWRSDILYYFENYNLKLPDDFIKKAIDEYEFVKLKMRDNEATLFLREDNQ